MRRGLLVARAVSGWWAVGHFRAWLAWMQCLSPMPGRIRSLRRRLAELTLTPAQYARTAYVALAALTLIVMSGAAVRLTGSGLGCPTWPRCYGKIYPPLETHAVIEFSNRMITVPVSIAAIAAFVLAFRRRPYRRDLMRLSALLPLGVLAQAVLGGLTVRGALDYGWVMGHFALSMLVLVAAVALAWRATYEPGERSLRTDRTLTLWARAAVALGALTIFAGTAATAAGPHAGGSPGQKINRLDFDGKGHDGLRDPPPWRDRACVRAGGVVRLVAGAPIRQNRRGRSCRSACASLLDPHLRADRLARGRGARPV